MTDVADLGAWLDDQLRLANRLTVPVLMSTDAAVDMVVASKTVDQAERRLTVARNAQPGGTLAESPEVAAAVSDLDDARSRLAEAEEAATAHMVDFVVESVGADMWEALEGAHPPTDKDRQRRGEDAAWDGVRFPMAAIAFCLREPARVGPDELDGYMDAILADDVLPGLPSAAKLKAKVPDTVWEQLFAAVVRVNRGINPVPKSWGGSAATPPSATGSGPRPS